MGTRRLSSSNQLSKHYAEGWPQSCAVIRWDHHYETSAIRRHVVVSDTDVRNVSEKRPTEQLLRTRRPERWIGSHIDHHQPIAVKRAVEEFLAVGGPHRLCAPVRRNDFSTAEIGIPLDIHLVLTRFIGDIG